MQTLLETTLFYWFLFTMHTEKAKLISCFVNDYYIPTTLFKTKSKLKSIFLTCTQTELCKMCYVIIKYSLSCYVIK